MKNFLSEYSPRMSKEQFLKFIEDMSKVDLSGPLPTGPCATEVWFAEQEKKK